MWFSAGSSNFAAGCCIPLRRKRLRPDLAFNPFDGFQLGSHRRGVRKLAVDLNARIQIAAKTVTQAGLSLNGQDIETQIGGPDRVHLLDDQVAPGIQARGRARKRECDDQAEQPENGAIDNSCAVPGAVRVMRGAPARNAPADLGEGQHPDEHRRRKSDGRNDEAHLRPLTDATLSWVASPPVFGASVARMERQRHPGSVASWEWSGPGFRRSASSRALTPVFAGYGRA